MNAVIVLGMLVHMSLLMSLIFTVSNALLLISSAPMVARADVVWCYIFLFKNYLVRMVVRCGNYLHWFPVELYHPYICDRIYRELMIDRWTVKTIEKYYCSKNRKKGWCGIFLCCSNNLHSVSEFKSGLKAQFFSNSILLQEVAFSL